VAAVPTVSRQRLRDTLEPVVRAAGYDLEDVAVAAAGRRNVLRVVVDRDGGVDLDAVADVSRAVSEALDGDDVMGDAPYTLEVSSPGVDRPLTEPRHWRRAAGRLVRAPLREGGEVTGRVVQADDATVTLDVAGSPMAIRFDQLGTGHVQLEFSRRETAED
jgi:ribosome maturation factor RimP